MGTCTAQIMIGQSHIYDGGIVNMSHVATLSENGVARWTIRQSGWFDESKQEVIPVSWIPNPHTMLEDGILMIALFVWKNPELLDLAGRLFKMPLNKIEIINDDSIHDDDLRTLHDKCRSLQKNSKLVFTILNGSSLVNQIEVLDNYHFEVEVCRTVSSKS